MKKTIFALLMIFALALTACGGTDGGNTAGNTASDDGAVSESSASDTSSGTSSQSLQDGYEDALGIQLQLSVGTFRLEDTDLAVNADQAAELIPLWQVLNNLNQSGTAAQEEIDALVAQIQETMSAEQINTIAAMELTRVNMGEIMQEFAFSFGNGETPPEGFVPGQGRGGSGVPGLSGGGPGSQGGDMGMSPEQIATARAERESSGQAGSMINGRISRVIVDGLIELLQSK